MPRFAQMIVDGMVADGHTVNVWTPLPLLFRLPVGKRIRKWTGYFDQYIFFLLFIRLRLLTVSKQTLFVFADQALGPWVPWLRHRPHVIHCHDLLALRSAMGEVAENPTSLTGRLYQRFIRWGFAKGRNFISVSEKTRQDLHRLARISPDLSAVVYNGLNYAYQPLSLHERMDRLQSTGLPVEERGMLLHVGGGQWYKNRPGVVALYAAYAATVPNPLPLWMVGPTDQTAVLEAMRHVPTTGKVHLLTDLDAKVLHAAYAHAALFVFPSLDEGFGWPIAEAQACGTLVLTTAAAPMTEVGGDAAFYLDRLTGDNAEGWATDGAAKICAILSMDADARADAVTRGLINAARFDAERTIAEYTRIYLQVLQKHSGLAHESN